MEQHPVILFDGVCNLCNASVRLLIRLDTKKRFRFAALDSNAARRLTIALEKPANCIDSIILVKDGRLFCGSEAALRIAAELPWYWQWSRIFGIVPFKLREPVYRWIASNRYRWFGKKDHCLLPTPELQERFL